MCVARFGGCRVARRRFGPRWRSGRSPSTPVRYRRSTPLSPTAQPNLHISSHRCPPSITALHRKARKTRGFERARSRGALPGTCARRHAVRRSARVLAPLGPAGGPSVRRVCLLWGAVGYPSIDLRRDWTRLLRCGAMKTARLLVLTLVLALSAAIVAGCGSSSGSGGGDDPAALIPAGAQIQQLVDSSGKSDDVTLKDDVEPWLGNRVGFAVTALHTGRNADYAA